MATGRMEIISRINSNGMSETETLKYMQLLKAAFDLLLEKKECMITLLNGATGKKEKACLKRVEELEVLLEENDRHLRKFDHLKEPVIQELH